MADNHAMEVAVYPTLVVGVGGTGCKIAKRLKRTLQAEGAGNLTVRFVGIDTDRSESATHSEEEAPLDLFVSIGGKSINFDPKDRTNEPMLHWLPADDAGKLVVSEGKLSNGQGAGGHRLVGRFAYNYFAPEQFTAFQHTVDELVSLGNNPFAGDWQNIRFRYQPGLVTYVVGSLVGGTGSGSFLDALATVHRLTGRALADQQRYFIGMFLLPSVFDYRAIGSQTYDHKATAYSCLKDVDLLLSDDDPSLRSFWYYYDPEPFVVSERFMDSCYLVDRYSGSGALLQDEDVYDLVTTHLYASIGTPFGAASNSVANNSHKTNIRDLHGGLCSYSAFGLVGMDYSQKLAVRYCASRLGIETIDRLLGTAAEADSAAAEAAGFLDQAGLSGGPNSRVVSVVEGDVGRNYRKPPEEVEEERTGEVYEGLPNGYQEFTASLEKGSLRGQLEENYLKNLTGVPQAQPDDSLRPGQERTELEMWRYRVGLKVEQTTGSKGLRAGLKLAQALREGLERSLGMLEAALTGLRNNATAAQAEFNSSLETVHRLTPAVEFFRRQVGREARRTAGAARNALIQSRVREEAAKMATRVFSDGQNGLIPMLDGMIRRLRSTMEALETARSGLAEQAGQIEAGSREGAGVEGAPDRSVLLYDILPSSDFASMYSVLSEGKADTLRRMLLQYQEAAPGTEAPDSDISRDGRAALRLLDTVREEHKSAALAQRILERAATLFPELANRHIFDVLTQGVMNQEEREQRMRDYLTRVCERLRPHAPVRARQGDGKPYEYCVVLYPHHDNDALVRAFVSAAEQMVRQQTGVTPTVVPSSGANNRIVLTYMQHGIPLNAEAFPRLTEWLRAYECLRPRNPFLDVDRRWSKRPGPGQRDLGNRREKLFALGLAYGLIAQQGDHFYANLRTSLRADTGGNEREAYEVDLEEVKQAVTASSDPVAWFSHLTQGPSGAPNIPTQFGIPLGAKKARQARDRIGQGRATAMRAFVEDQGEDFGDVADGIAAVMEAYAEERGRAQIRREMEWYLQQLQEEADRSSDLREQYQRELKLLNELMENLNREGRFDLPLGE